MRPRPYQHDAGLAIHAAFAQYSRVLAVLPTGMGKTVIFAFLTDEWERGRVLIVAPMIELCGQAAKKVYEITGVMPAIEQADQWSNESSWVRSHCVVASKQTLTGRKKRFQRFDNIGLVVLDEADTMITKPVAEMVNHFTAQGAKVLGVTATAVRGDKRAMANLFEHCAFHMSIADAIPQGWLVPPKAHCVQLKSLDLSEVGKKKDGDFKDAELAKVMEDERVVFEVAETTALESGTLKTVVYCAGVEEARKVANRLVDTHGLKADWVCGDQKLCHPQRRAEVLRSFTQDPTGVQIVCNVGVLTRGWDFPGLQHIVMGRPTRSLNLYTQILGRGTRPLPGVVDFEGSTAETRVAAIAASAKPHFKVTDLRDNSLHHKLVSSVDVLSGSMGFDAKVIAAAKKKMDKAAEAIDVGTALADAQKEFEQRERRRLARVAAKAEVKRVEVDPFDPRQRAGLSRSEPTSKIVKFGKYKGQRWSDVPDNYLDWVVHKSNLPQVLKGMTWNEIRRRRPKPVAVPREAVRPPDQPSESQFWALLNQFTEAK